LPRAGFQAWRSGTPQRKCLNVSEGRQFFLAAFFIRLAGRLRLQFKN
jgi:hypothetical protein